jgi:hypothetical protein
MGAARFGGGRRGGFYWNDSRCEASSGVFTGSLRRERIAGGTLTKRTMKRHARGVQRT